jgi:hypothetical protein
MLSTQLRSEATPGKSERRGEESDASANYQYIGYCIFHLLLLLLLLLLLYTELSLGQQPHKHPLYDKAVQKEVLQADPRLSTKFVPTVGEHNVP